MHAQRAWPAMLGLVCAMGLVGCERAPDGRDARPTDADAADGPRIVSLSPGLTLTLADLGLADRIVGRHAWDRSLDPAVPMVGDQTGLDYESLARTAPTHVVIELGAGGAPDLLASLAHERGWRIIALPMLSLDDVTGAIDLLGDRFGGSPGVSAAAADLLTRAETAWAADAGFAERAGRMLIVYWTSPLGVAGPGSFHHDLVRRLGAVALPVSGGPYQTLDTEDVRAASPDSIVLLTPDLAEADLSATVARWRRAGVPAATLGRVAVLRDWRYLTPGPALLDLARALREASSGWPAVGVGLDTRAGERR